MAGARAWPICKDTFTAGEGLEVDREWLRFEGEMDALALLGVDKDLK
jgi:hypothetical protein